jgi:hypothetical protein
MAYISEEDGTEAEERGARKCKINTVIIIIAHEQKTMSLTLQSNRIAGCKSWVRASSLLRGFKSTK